MVANACPAVDAAVGNETGVAGAADAGVNCSASCDFAGGVAVGCATRFQYGINFAWDQFAGDFGGISAFGTPGVSRNGRVACELADMRAHGVDTIRWWVWPDFRGVQLLEGIGEFQKRERRYGGLGKDKEHEHAPVRPHVEAKR